MWAESHLATVFIICTLCVLIVFGFNKIQPKIYNDDGHLIIESAKDRNISFNLPGEGRFVANETDVMSYLKPWQTPTEVDISQNDKSLADQINDIRKVLSGPNGLFRRVDRLRNSTTFGDILPIYRLRRRVYFLATTVAQIEAKLKTDNCSENPCENGGTCVDLYDDFRCKCPENWQGKTCNVDVDECYRFAGTDLGCQNNAVCVNTIGSYRCECTQGWKGLHCTNREVDCYISPKELCGNGVCVSQSNDLGYSCICNTGWKSNNDTPACTEDIDECAELKHRCVSKCINLPGDFMCGPCPAGYTGDGITCRDIDECETNNGGCSLAPHVRCINTEGSFRCGNCPMGYSGDGKTCNRDENSCQNYGICHPQATCRYVSNSVICTCPPGMTGNGYGPTGCALIGVDACNPNQCKNGGTCRPHGASYICICPPGFEDEHCQIPNPCKSNPCKNGATCLPRFNRNYKCLCTSGFQGTNCEDDRIICGTVLRLESGSITYPRSGNYKPNERCAWVIKTHENKILNVTFTKFDLQEHVACSRDFLQIHDGRSAAHQLIGQFCGNSLPKGGNFNSTHNMVYFWFKSDAILQKSGFALSWNTVDPICGGRIEVSSHGVIQSPGYPAKSPPNRDCEWILEAPPGKVLDIVFYEVDLPRNDNCDGDFLEVLNDEIEKWSLKKFCSNIRSAPIKSGSNQVIINFHSDNSSFDSSFQLHYSTVEALHFCGGVFTQPEGGFESPKYGTFAGTAITCNYLIQTTRDTIIHLDFPSLNFGNVLDCGSNSLMIFDGKTDNDPIIDIWCRSGTPTNYTSTSNAMLIRYKFSSNLNRLKFDFRAHYKIGCGGMYKGLSGSFVSPNSPQEYLPNMNCFYTIEVPQGFAITLTMEYFHLTHKYFWIGNKCNTTDHIIVYSPVVSNASIIGMFCKDFPNVIISKYNRMIVQFVTDDTMQFSGFKALYESEEIGCGAVLSEPNGTISFLNSKQLEKCEWILNAPDNHHIFINFEKFHILDNQSCKTNFLQIKDLNENTRDKHMGTFCGQNQARSGTFSTNRLSIVFVAETESATDEFSATYQFLDTSPTSCRSHAIEFIAPSGSLYSPGWPGNYFPDLNCSWILRAPMGHRIILDVKSFSLESSGANYDYVEIRDGYLDAPPIGRFYGIKIPSRIMSFTNTLYITFKTDDSVNKKGFHFEWQTTTVGCGGTLNSYEGFIIPPHYPDLISPGAQCDWRIIVNPGSSINAVLTSQNYQELGGCDTKQIIVFNGDNPSADRIKPNCSEQALHYTSTKNHMLIRYETEANEESSFIVNYNAKCGGELRDLRGVVESPNFPHKYPEDLDCKWDIISTKGNKIVLAVSHLDLEDETCYYDKLYISDVKAGEVLHEYTLCSEENLGRVITALGDTLRVHFRSDYQNSGTGFRLEYELQGCSKHLSSPLGRQVESPNYPYAINVHCEWVIEAPYGKKVDLRILPFYLEGSTDDCSKNGLIVYSDEARSNALVKLCTTHTDKVTVTSVGSKIFLTFFTDEVRAKKYFRATYNFKPGNCGGIYNAKSGYIISPNFPSKYPKGASCVWLVSSGDHHTVDLSFEHFSIPNVTNCEDSFLEVYDGSEKKAEHLVLRHCGTLLPLKNLIQSTQQKMFIIFKASNITEPGFGFKIFYKRNCGIKIVDRVNGVITKGFNDNNCLWTISSTNSSAHVTLHFSHIECKCTTDIPDYCEQNMGVQVYDGDSIEAPRKTSFCTKHPLTIYSNGPALTIRAVGGYFQAYYNLFENACGGKLTSVRGEFATPKYPNSYPPNVECVWEINAEEGNTIEVSFNKFQIHKTSEQCNEDYVEIRENGGGGKFLGAFCGNDPPQPLRTYEKAWIKFRSDDNFVGDGFLATWSYVHESEINGTFGILKSPPIENVNIDPENYKWRIVAPRGNLIEINFNQYVDGVRLFDGYDETALPVEFEYKSTITSSTNIVYITSENSILRPFLIRWQAVPINTTEETEADTTLTKKIIVIPMNDVVNITSPGYPKGYANELDYEWILKPNDSSVHVVLTFFGADLEQSPDCVYDYIKIYSSENMFDWTLLETYCNEPIFMRPIKIFHGTPYLKLVFHTDTSRNGTGFLFRATTFCGADMTEPEGVIKGITGFFNMHLPRNCTWAIRVIPGRRIKFLFKKMEIPAPTDHNSCDEYVSIRDGFDEGAALLGKGMFCKGSNLTIPETTTNRAFVRAFIVHFQDMDWELQYTSVSDTCGGSIHITREKNSTNFTTPNYPDVPNPYSECIWTVLGPPGEILLLSFPENFDLYPSWDCATEFVEVRDGSTSISKLIKKFCRKPPLIRSTGNAFYIKYFTNSSEPRNGFKAHITFGKCGGTFFGDGNGDITSKNYPSLGGYPSNSVCEYKIKIWRLHSINITFNDVHLPVRPNRNESDHLTFYVEDDVENGTMVEVATIYGDNAPPFLQFTSNEVVFKFFSYQPNTQYRGYSFSFKRITNHCNRAINAESGQIVFPRKTFRQGAIITFCSWIITVPRGRRINVVVDEFDVGEGGLSDYSLTFYDDILRTHKILSTINVADIKSVNSTANKMLIRLFNYNRSRLYVKLNFTSYELSYCPVDITQDNGTIIAPDVSENYYCTTEYRLDQGQTIAFKISELIVATNNTPLVNILRQSNSLVIKGKHFVMFESSRNVTDVLVVVAFREGRIYMSQNEMKKINRLLIQYKKYDCGGEYFANTDTIITKPEFNGHNETMDCAWSLRIAYQLKFNLNASFSLNPDCEKEYILIYSGSGPTAPQLAKICRNTTLSRIISSNIYVHYHKDATIVASKFEIILTKIVNCGGTIYHNYGYPSDVAIAKTDYQNNLECIWNLEYKLGFTSEIAFTDRFFIEDSVNCTKDYVEIRGFLDNEWKTYPRFCGRHVPEKFNVTHTKLMVIFRTDNNTVGDGFRISFTMMCGGVFNATEKPQMINFDTWDIYNYQLQCNYTLRTHTENRIKVHIDSLEMGGSKGCADSFVDVYKGNTLSQVRKYCSAENLKDIYATHAVQLFVQGIHDTVLHFSFTYQLESCGGVVTEDTTIQSLSHETFEDHYTDNMNCLWNITGPPGSSVFIEFKYFDFHVYDCDNDYVDIFAGHELSNANKKAHICGDPAQQNILYKIPENMALVQAVSDSSISLGKGFSAAIRFKKKCDEKVLLSHQNSTYTFDRFANGYEPNLNCLFVFVAPDGNYVRMNFHSFNLTKCGETKCTCDFLETRDGDAQNLPLHTFCGDKLPPIVISSRNKLFVHFASNEVDAGQGFNATVSFIPSPCGPSEIILNETKEVIIKSPDLNGYYPPNTVCHWTLQYPQAIEFHFDEFELEEPQESGQCLDFLEISFFPYNFVDADDPNHKRTRLILCGNRTSTSYYMTKQNAELTFRSNFELQRRGFKATLRSANACNITYTALSGEILKRPDVDECILYFKVPATYTLTFTIHHAFFDNNCSRMIEFYDENTKQQVQTTCATPQVAFINSNNVKVKLSKDLLEPLFGLQMTYFASNSGLGCGGNLNGHLGKIPSPLYPKTDGNYSCQWNIQVPPGVEIYFSFLVFDMGSVGTCSRNYVTLFEVSATGVMSEVRRYCGDVKPATYVSKVNRLALVYHKVVEFDGTGWVAAYSTYI